MQSTTGRIALLDPINMVAYSRMARKDAKYHEDEQLQSLLNDKGLAIAKQFASRNYGGVYVAVLAD